MENTIQSGTMEEKLPVTGEVEWDAKWATPEQARNALKNQNLTDEEALLALGVPRELSGKPMEEAPGIVSPRGRVKNILVTVGLADIVKNIGYGLSAVTGFQSIAVGSSSSAVQTTDTTLTTELTTYGWGRGSATVSSQTTTLAGDTLQLLYAFTLTGTPGTVQEIGIFNNASSGGDMLTHALTGTITLPAGTVVTFTYKVKFASA
jgi:hypothetical protein